LNGRAARAKSRRESSRSSAVPATPNDILHFWRTAGPQKWFKKDARFDEAIRLKFEPVHHAAARGEYDGWAGTPDGALALVILLDQFPRNLYRGSAHAFATDGKARAAARAAVASGFHLQVERELAGFFVLPFEHSEHLADQDAGVAAAEQIGDAEVTKWCRLHRDIIARFGRFPHRNPALGRTTTPEEQAFLDDDGFSG
jgi:uncharacterized protein (DUF924 family)